MIKVGDKGFVFLNGISRERVISYIEIVSKHKFLENTYSYKVLKVLDDRTSKYSHTVGETHITPENSIIIDPYKVFEKIFNFKG